jgi:GNAT superfamily N-acetyltransferase
MVFVLLGWPPDGPTLRLDHRRFVYAGKFVLGSTGKAVVWDESAAGDWDESAAGDWDESAPGDEATTPDCEAVLAAASFSPDRTDDDRLVVRYLTVRDDRQGEGLGSRLLAFVADRAEARGYERVRIGVNNPAAYVAAVRAGFGFTGEETGLAELVCERPGSRDPATFREGLDRFRGRDLEPAALDRLAERRAAGPPAVVDPPAGRDATEAGSAASGGDGAERTADPGS